ncbi:hypothetical protein MSG28_001696 [Choristoneura fumiferana]|uniref:Uncharacterized protein n=1 Tax=Choristoneura fumiferana TaxID=7141 RepID=A0ACC0KVN3_CHOFU|nr:hypothetical protein MSG28_001696 [Choristoneura fumiferana]
MTNLEFDDVEQKEEVTGVAAEKANILSSPAAENCKALLTLAPVDNKNKCRPFWCLKRFYMFCQEILKSVQADIIRSDVWVSAPPDSRKSPENINALFAFSGYVLQMGYTNKMYYPHRNTQLQHLCSEHRKKDIVVGSRDIIV